MNIEPDLGRCLTFINCQMWPSAAAVLPSEQAARWHTVTISRQAGSGGHLVAEKIAHILQTQGGTNSVPWTIFDRNIVEKTLEDHHLPASLAKFLREDRVSQIDDALEELFGLHPPTWTLVDKTAETILRLAELGNVILIGRGANVITSRLPHILHVRLISPLEQRIEFVRKTRDLTRPQAAEVVRQEDHGRERYVRTYYHKDIADPTLYHIVLNTGILGYDVAATLIANAILLGLPAKHSTTTLTTS